MQQNKPPEGKSVPMINSFLNLCRVCPVPTEDKKNLEDFGWYRFLANLERIVSVQESFGAWNAVLDL
ncbi:hypothetical protein CDAR_165541 [Caerostris darwini]|uniref:Uncharacterized protein n=1 Tax=Caerostris darwini TaxID=1538125 RepID=A0AAV4W7Y7_9ARAC|nr:hypothetical protein CDAR_165541 [Caerostris darwini]